MTASSADTRFWNGVAESYAAKPVADPEAFERKIAITRERMRPEHVVLDIGCGTGSLALRLADAAAEVHGLDVSAEMIRIAEGKADAVAADNVRFHVGAFDAEFDVFGDNELDGLCAYSILHLVPDLDAALAQIYRLLRPGGFFVSSTVCLRDSWVPFKPIIAVMRWFGKAPRVTMLSRDQLVAGMRRAGFVDIEIPDVGAEPTVSFVTARKPG